MDIRTRRAWWSCVFAVNLIAPGLLACLVASRLAWIGVFPAVAAYWLAGTHLCERHPMVARALIIGGIIVGFSQLFPILQMYAGKLALLALPSPRWEDRPPLGEDRPRLLIGPLDGFLATAITGGILLSVALLVGGILAASFPPRDRKPTVKSSLFDQEIDG